MTHNTQGHNPYQGQACCHTDNVQHQGYTHTGFEAGAL